MSSYEVTQDAVSGVVTCRVNGFMSDNEARSMAEALLTASDAERRLHGSIRLLFDNRSGTVFSTTAMQALASELHANRRLNDRTAVLVANSLNKLQAKRSMSDNCQVFISESAARTWLQAWDGAAPAPDRRPPAAVSR